MACLFVAQPSAHFLQVCVYYKDGKEKKLTSVKYREKYKKVNVTCRLFLWKNVWEDKPQPKKPQKNLQSLESQGPPSQWVS